MNIKDVLAMHFDASDGSASLRVRLDDGTVKDLKFTRDSAHRAGLTLLCNRVDQKDGRSTDRHPVMGSAAQAVSFGNGQEGIVVRILGDADAYLAVALPTEAMDSMAQDFANRKESRSRSH